MIIFISKGTNLKIPGDLYTNVSYIILFLHSWVFSVMPDFSFLKLVKNTSTTQVTIFVECYLVQLMYTALYLLSFAVFLFYFKKDFLHNIPLVFNFMLAHNQYLPSFNKLYWDFLRHFFLSALNFSTFHI